nr:MAG TPA: hypothetical protein [Crassvirales sp.]
MFLIQYLDKVRKLILIRNYSITGESLERLSI